MQELDVTIKAVIDATSDTLSRRYGTTRLDNGIGMPIEKITSPFMASIGHLIKLKTSIKSKYM